MAFAEELLKNRKARKLTQEDLAERCNVSRQAIAKWEKSESLPDIYTVARLADLFNMSIEDLIYSRENVLAENKGYYLRVLQETDRTAFLRLMREHRYLGKALRELDKIGESSCDDEIWDLFFKEQITHVICLKGTQELIAYFSMDELETASPQMTMQFAGSIELDTYILELIRDYFDMICKDYRMKAICVSLNSELEKQIFREFGYENAEEEVLVALPLTAYR